MSEPVRYGEMQSEKVAEENRICREIVREIANFGVNDRQRWMIMYLLGAELESVEEMQAVTSWVNEVMGDKLFLRGVEAPSGKICT